MAKIDMTKLYKMFQMWDRQIDPAITQRTGEYLYLADNQNRLMIEGTGLTYDQNGVPVGGIVTRVWIDVGADDEAGAVHDIDVTGLQLDFADFAPVIAKQEDFEKTQAFWVALLQGDDVIDLGDNSGREFSDVSFSGDGYRTLSTVSVGGNDTITGDVRLGNVYGDYLFVENNHTLFAGDDTITITSPYQATVIGDVYQSKGSTYVGGGDDRLQISAGGHVVGDVYGVYGVVDGGNDTIIGSKGSDTLIGDAQLVAGTGLLKGGDDEIRGGAGGDVIYGDMAATDAGAVVLGGNDKLYGDAGQDTIYGNGGDDYLDGGADADTLVGDEGNDVLRGGSGKDALSGGQGFDTGDYRDKTVKLDIRLDAEADGIAKVNGAAEDNLDSVENLLGGSASDYLSASADSGANRFEGGAGHDTISTGGGDDILIGGSGNDVLTGGTGRDVLTGGSSGDGFRFTGPLAADNIDTITDFSHGSDRLVLDDAIFKALGSSVTSSEFVALSSGHAATNSHQHIIYDKSNGSLWYDVDGKGGADAVQFAQLGTAASHPKTLTYDDFSII